MIAHSGRPRVERKMGGLTAPECREYIVRHLTERGGWVPIAELAEWMVERFGLSRGQGASDLHTLVREGRIERRATAPEGSRFKANEYRAVTG